MTTRTRLLEVSYRASRLDHALVAGLTVLAIAVRLPNLDWGLPHIEEEAFPLKKAFAMWGWADGRVQLDPETAGWPSLSFYVHLLMQQAHFWLSW